MVRVTGVGLQAEGSAAGMEVTDVRERPAASVVTAVARSWSSTRGLLTTGRPDVVVKADRAALERGDCAPGLPPRSAAAVAAD